MGRESYMSALTISKEKQVQIIKVASSMGEKQKNSFLQVRQYCWTMVVYHLLAGLGAVGK